MSFFGVMGQGHRLSPLSSLLSPALRLGRSVLDEDFIDASLSPQPKHRRLEVAFFDLIPTKNVNRYVGEVGLVWSNPNQNTAEQDMHFLI